MAEFWLRFCLDAKITIFCLNIIILDENIIRIFIDDGIVFFVWRFLERFI